MSSPPPGILQGPVLDKIPASLRTELLQAYSEILKNFQERRWEPAELNGGKLCEVVYTILFGYANGTYAARASKPQNMVVACQALESINTSIPRSARIQIPRMLIALYEIRNNRGVGHVGGDVNPNHMDAVCVLGAAKWVVSELIRMFHNLTTKDAALVVDALVDRTLPLVWEVGGKQRVLNPGMSMLDKTLVILYRSARPITESDLLDWVEHSNRSVYRRDVLRKAHKRKLIEYDPAQGTAQISPLGIDYIETTILDRPA